MLVLVFLQQSLGIGDAEIFKMKETVGEIFADKLYKPMVATVLMLQSLEFQ